MRLRRLSVAQWCWWASWTTSRPPTTPSTTSCTPLTTPTLGVRRQPDAVRRRCRRVRWCGSALSDASARISMGLTCNGMITSHAERSHLLLLDAELAHHQRIPCRRAAAGPLIDGDAKLLTRDELIHRANARSDLWCMHNKLYPWPFQSNCFATFKACKSIDTNIKVGLVASGGVLGVSHN